MKYEDKGVAMVEKFHTTFGCAVRDVPGIPVLSIGDTETMYGVSRYLLGYAERLKGLAGVVNQNGSPALGLLLVRLQLMVEETGELAEALADQDLVAALDALTDISYVVDGTYLTLGLGHVKPAADEEVHRSNMSKLGPDGQPIIGISGRVIKGPGYSPPDLVRVLAEHALKRAEKPSLPPGAGLVERWD